MTLTLTKQQLEAMLADMETEGIESISIPTPKSTAKAPTPLYELAITNFKQRDEFEKINLLIFLLWSYQTVKCGGYGFIIDVSEATDLNTPTEEAKAAFNNAWAFFRDVNVSNNCKPYTFELLAKKFFAELFPKKKRTKKEPILTSSTQEAQNVTHPLVKEEDYASNIPF